MIKDGMEWFRGTLTFGKHSQYGDIVEQSSGNWSHLSTRANPEMLSDSV